MEPLEREAQRLEKRTRMGSAAVMVSALVLLDLPLELLCLRFPLLFYILAAGFGYAIGGRVSRWMSPSKSVANVLRVGARIIIILGVLGGNILSFYHPPWNSKCSWRSCGRVLGPGLLESPFPAPPTSCQNLSRCANEYRYSDAGYRALCQHMEERGCAPP